VLLLWSNAEIFDRNELLSLLLLVLAHERAYEKTNAAAFGRLGKESEKNNSLEPEPFQRTTFGYVSQICPKGCNVRASMRLL